MELLIGGEFLSYASLIGQLKKDILLIILLDIPRDMYPFSIFGSVVKDTLDVQWPYAVTRVK